MRQIAVKFVSCLLNDDQKLLSMIFLFQKMKIHLKDSYSKILQRFRLIAVVLDSIMEWEYQLCLQQWKKC